MRGSIKWAFREINPPNVLLHKERLCLQNLLEFEQLETRLVFHTAAAKRMMRAQETQTTEILDLVISLIRDHFLRAADSLFVTAADSQSRPAASLLLFIIL